jgi:8-oxo-dGTP diphosphatase
VLLVQRPSGVREPFPGKWALPIVFIDTARDQDLEACARRKLMEKTGVKTTLLRSTRKPRHCDASPLGDALSTSHQWRWTTSHRGPQETRRNHGGSALAERGPGALAFDHAEILRAALAHLRSKVERRSLHFSDRKNAL